MSKPSGRMKGGNCNDGQHLIPFTEAQEADPHSRKPRRGFVTTIKLKLLSFDNPIYDRAEPAYEELHVDASDGVSVTSASVNDLRLYSPRHFRNRRVALLIMAGLVLAVCLVVGLSIPLALSESSSSGTSEMKSWNNSNQDTTTKSSRIINVVKVTDTFQGNFHVVAGQYSSYIPQYADPSSAKFQAYARDFVDLLDEIYRKSALFEVYDSTQVLQLSEGSVQLEFNLVFAEDIVVSPLVGVSPHDVTANDVTETLMKAATPGQSHADLVKLGNFVIKRDSLTLKPINMRLVPRNDDVTTKLHRPTTTNMMTTKMAMTSWQDKQSSTTRPTITTVGSTSRAPLVSTKQPITKTTDKVPTTVLTVSSPQPTVLSSLEPTLTPADCPDDSFLCQRGIRPERIWRGATSNFCLPENKVCDGYLDCVGDTDEDGCGDTCSNGGFRCVKEDAFDRILGGKCTWVSDECDGHGDCTDFSDEDHCSCNDDEDFRCHDGRDKRNGDHCIPKAYVCDRERDCTDDSDELNCTYNCPEDHFKCKVGMLRRYPRHGFCIHSHEQCDGHTDCEDGSDEVDCHLLCPEGKFKCTNGTVMWSTQPCLPMQYKCDRRPQCSDQSDEAGCDYTCRHGQFACDTGVIQRYPFTGYCLYEHERCNGFQECEDGSDEENCSTLCAANEFPCVNGTSKATGKSCISKRYICDKVDDCTDGSDEDGCLYQCPNQTFPCQTGVIGQPENRGFCLMPQARCDGITQCVDESDEAGCDQTCPPHRPFRCETGTNVHHPTGDICVLSRFVCDRDTDCSDGSDEANCNYTCPAGQFACLTGAVSRWPFMGYCIFQTEVCDGYVDCQDKSDEQDCEPVTCSPDQFQCLSGGDVDGNQGCVHQSKRCNKYVECFDGSDESDCEYKCGAGQFTCSSLTNTGEGFCVPLQSVCDGKNDCLHGSDELNCSTPCQAEEFQCLTGVDQYLGHKCIDSHLHCDRHTDCLDSSDEDGCHFDCPAGHFQCADGTVSRAAMKNGTLRGFCIPNHLVCDHVDHCLDGSDEIEATCDIKCEPSAFRCFNSTNRYGTRRCIPGEYRCDRDRDCLDGSDEEMCEYACPTGQVSCDTGIISRWPFIGYCIKEQYICDAEWDCADGSDEIKCNSPCGESEFRCVNGWDKGDKDVCIPSDYVCDRITDCSDGSDEAECNVTCREGMFKCHSGVLNVFPFRGFCLPERLQCDGQAQCTDGSDEDECQMCLKNEFRCDNGDCVWGIYRCDRDADCSDGSDEKDCSYQCPRGQFKCVNGTVTRWPFSGYCVHAIDVCDGHRDCQDNSDEHDCEGTASVTCPEGQFACRVRSSGLTGSTWDCVDNSFLCDRSMDCVDGADEDSCTYTCDSDHFKCATGTISDWPQRGYCVNRARLCNSEPDCVDSSDEASCQ